MTDRRTDGQTDRILIARPRLHSMQRGKNDIASHCRTAGCAHTLFQRSNTRPSASVSRTHGVIPSQQGGNQKVISEGCSPFPSVSLLSFLFPYFPFISFLFLPASKQPSNPSKQSGAASPLRSRRWVSRSAVSSLRERGPTPHISVFGSICAFRRYKFTGMF